MSLTIVPMLEPRVLRDLISILGTPDRIYMTHKPTETFPINSEIDSFSIRHDPLALRVEVEFTADKLPAERLLTLYKKQFEDFKKLGTRLPEERTPPRIKEVVWLKFEKKGKVIQGDRQYYYIKFDCYGISGSISPARAPAVASAFMKLCKKHGEDLSVKFGAPLS